MRVCMTSGGGKGEEEDGSDTNNDLSPFSFPILKTEFFFFVGDLPFHSSVLFFYDKKKKTQKLKQMDAASSKIVAEARWQNEDNRIEGEKRSLHVHVG